ncbi:MAG: hypothetical protein ACOCXZ_03825 [Chloroflexota bacterium]
MSIRLDWEVESEQSRTSTTGEDPSVRRKRRRGYVSLLLTLLLIGAVLGGVVVFVVERVNQVTESLETALRDTVQAEIVALRIGDWNAFAAVQRSATGDWLRQQRTEFENYQRILLESEDTRLTGQVLDITLDDPRARVEVQEIIDGVPYSRIWFYWYYEEDTDGDGEMDLLGWRHVPPDYTFWGDGARYEGQYVDVAYRAVDSRFAQSLGESLDAWVGDACAALDCGTLPLIRVQVLPEENSRITWDMGAPPDEWVLVVPSPYATRARTDMPFSPEIRFEVASLLAERMTLMQAGGRRMIDTADAAYLNDAVVRWLVGRFVSIDMGSTLIQSLAEAYGPRAVGSLIAQLPQDASIAFVSQITGQPLDLSGLDWRDFISWRLELETSLAEIGIRERYRMLYDTRDQNVLLAADQRFEQGGPPAGQQVIAAGSTISADDGSPQLVATVALETETGPSEYQILYRLVENDWRRAS